MMQLARLISPTGKWDRQVLDYDGDWACFPFLIHLAGACSPRSEVAEIRVSSLRVFALDSYFICFYKKANLAKILCRLLVRSQ